MAKAQVGEISSCSSYSRMKRISDVNLVGAGFKDREQDVNVISFPMRRNSPRAADAAVRRGSIAGSQLRKGEVRSLARWPERVWLRRCPATRLARDINFQIVP